MVPIKRTLYASIKGHQSISKILRTRPWTLGSMLLSKLVDLIAAKFAADFLDWTQQHIVAVNSLFRAVHIFIIVRGEIKQFRNMFTF